MTTPDIPTEALEAVRARVKGPLHEAFHALGPRIPNLNVGDCHCNLLAEVALDAVLAAAAPHLIAEGRRQVRAEMLAIAENSASVWELIRPTVPGSIANGDDHRYATHVIRLIVDRIADQP